MRDEDQVSSMLTNLVPVQRKFGRTEARIEGFCPTFPKRWLRDEQQQPLPASIYPPIPTPPFLPPSIPLSLPILPAVLPSSSVPRFLFLAFSPARSLNQTKSICLPSQKLSN